MNLADEAVLTELHRVRFLTLPIPDRDIPLSDTAAVEFVRALLEERAAERNVLVHFRQGVGRSGMIAAAVLIAGGAPVEDALSRISAARGVVVPETPPQRGWLERVAPILPAVSATRR